MVPLFRQTRAGVIDQHLPTVGIALIVVAKRGRNVPIPFGPYLAAAGLLATFWGKDLTQAYLRLM